MYSEFRNKLSYLTFPQQVSPSGGRESASEISSHQHQRTNSIHPPPSSRLEKILAGCGYIKDTKNEHQERGKGGGDRDLA